MSGQQPVSFNWQQKVTGPGPWAGDRYWLADLEREGIRIQIEVEEADPGPCPCPPGRCTNPGVPVLVVTATASVPGVTGPVVIAGASAELHALVTGPAATGFPDRRGGTGAQAIADCAAGQVADAARDALAQLGSIVRHAAKLGITSGRAARKREVPPPLKRKAEQA